MPRRIALYLALWNIAFSLTSSVAFAGGAHTGGADNLSLQTGSAWFLGASKPIIYCYELSPQFGVESTTIESTIQSTLATWHRYIMDKGVYQDATTRQNGMTLASTGELTGCDDPRVELRFFFGVTNSRIAADRARYEDPAAFVHRDSYDMRQGRGTGYVWLAPLGSVFPESRYPDWRQPYVLFGILLHEWGHIFGNDHVEGTIMTANINELVVRASLDLDTHGKDLLSRIDGERELQFCGYQCSGNYQGFIGEGPNDEAATFRLLANRDPRGQVKAELHTAAHSAKLQVSDDIGHVDIEFPLHDDETVFLGDNAVFHVAKTISAGKDSADISLVTKPVGLIRYSEIKLSNGKTVPIVIEQNASLAGKVRIYYLDPGKHLLFSMLPFQSRVTDPIHIVR